MKKFILNLTLIAFLATALGAYAAPVSNAQIKALIRKYKAQNYTGCVQDAQTLIQKDPSNSAVYYYQGLAYYQLGKTDKATEAFEKVITLNSNSTLVEYANKGIHCINNDEECKLLGPTRHAQKVLLVKTIMKVLFVKHLTKTRLYVIKYKIFMKVTM